MDKRDWKPPRFHQSLEVFFQRAFKDGLLKSRIKNIGRPNLTKEQWIGLKELPQNSKILIEKTDKGSAVAVMTTTDYFRVVYRQLIDPKYYTKLDHDPTTQSGKTVHETLTQM